VRFNGMIREEAGAAAVPFDEVWNLTKPSTEAKGWVVAGIQQAFLKKCCGQGRARGLVNHLLTGETGRASDWPALPADGASPAVRKRAVLQVTDQRVRACWPKPTQQAPGDGQHRLPDDAPLIRADRSASLFSAATISGSADLAETLGFVFRNLRWDIEHDLSRVLGDIVPGEPAAGKGLAQWQLAAARNLASAWPSI
jgi:hypothetical protein